MRAVRFEMSDEARAEHASLASLASASGPDPLWEEVNTPLSKGLSQGLTNIRATSWPIAGNGAENLKPRASTNGASRHPSVYLSRQTGSDRRCVALHSTQSAAAAESPRRSPLAPESAAQMEAEDSDAQRREEQERRARHRSRLLNQPAFSFQHEVSMRLDLTMGTLKELISDAKHTCFSLGKQQRGRGATLYFAMVLNLISRL